MEKFELWIDESGDFQELKNLHKDYLEGSLVGGVLCKQSQVKNLDLAYILKDKSHAKEIKKDKRPEYVLPRLEYVKERGAKFVIFQNKKKAYILNSVYTYLNVFTEGVAKLVNDLISEYGKIELCITFAQRKDTTKSKNCRDIILDKEYENRLKEKLEVELIKGGVNRNKLFYSLKRVKANEERLDKKNLKVDMADMVCNTFLVKNSSVYNNEERNLIRELYLDGYIYNVFQFTNEERFERDIKNNNYVEAIMDIITFSNTENLDVSINKLIENMNEIEDGYVKFQLEQLISKIKFMVKYNRENEINLSLINKLKTLILSKLDYNKLEIQKFALELELLVLEIANHMGNNEIEEKSLRMLLKHIKKTKFSFETLQFYYRILIRKAVYETNIFDFKAAINTTDTIIDTLQDILCILNDGEINGVGEKVKSDILAKAYGTRLQARIFLLRNNKEEQLQKALYDSEKAMEQFIYERDKSQQYQYRSNIFAEIGDYEEALKYLAISLKFNEFNLNKDLKKLIKEINKKKKNNFEVMHLMKIIGLSSFNNKVISNELFNEFIKSQAFKDFTKEGISTGEYWKDKSHPTNIILWNIGRYYINNNSIKAALEYYDAAIKVCSKDKKLYTMRAIGLGIISEITALLYKKHSFKKESQKYEKQFIEYFKEFKQECSENSIYKYFIEYENIIEEIIVADIDKKCNLLMKLSNKITY